MTKNEIKNLLNAQNVRIDTLGKNKAGNYVARRGFFYRHDFDHRKMAEAITTAGFRVIDSGEVWKAFRGGASTANRSHWWVEFTEAPKTEEAPAQPAGG